MTTAERRAVGEETAPPRPRLSPLKDYDPIWLLSVNMAVIAFMWLMHGGLERTEEQGWLIAVGQISGLYAGVAVLLGLVLISRTPWLERRYGMDRMVRFHRYVGFTAAVLMVLHIITVTVGYARGTATSRSGHRWWIPSSTIRTWQTP